MGAVVPRGRAAPVQLGLQCETGKRAALAPCAGLRVGPRIPPGGGQSARAASRGSDAAFSIFLRYFYLCFSATFVFLSPPSARCRCRGAQGGDVPCPYPRARGCLPHAPSGRAAGAAFQGTGASPDPIPTSPVFRPGTYTPGCPQAEAGGWGRSPGCWGPPQSLGVGCWSPPVLHPGMLVPPGAGVQDAGVQEAGLPRCWDPGMLVPPDAGVQEAGPP